MTPLSSTGAKRILILNCLVIGLFLFAYLLQEFRTMGVLPANLISTPVFTELARMDSLFSDFKFKIRGNRPTKNPIVLVTIDSASLAMFGRWPWKRDVLAYLLERLFQLEASYVGWDILFSEPENEISEKLSEILKQKKLDYLLESFDSEKQFQAAAYTHRHQTAYSWVSESPCQTKYSSDSHCPVGHPDAIRSLPINFEKFSLETHSSFLLPNSTKTPVISFPSIIANEPLLNEISLHQGFANAFADHDGVIRRAGLLGMVGGKPHPSFALALASLRLGSRPKLSFGSGGQIEALTFTGQNPLPISGTGMMHINFRGPEGTFPSIPVHELLTDDESVSASDKHLAQQLKGAIVLIGATAAALGDIKATPVDYALSGVEVHANILDNILSGDMLVSNTAEHHPWFATLLIAFLMVLIPGLLLFCVDRVEAFAGISLLGATTSSVFLADLAAFTYFDRIWSSSFFYLEMAVLTFIALCKKYLLEEWARKTAQTTILIKEKELLVEQLSRVRMETELKTAQLVQSTLLAPTYLEHPDLDLAHYYTPAEECGGDLWDARLKNNKLSIFIADATGHGAPAAIVTAVAKSCFITIDKLIGEQVPQPAECLTILNEIIHTACREKLFMSMFFLMIDLDTGVVLFSNAGHETPLCLRNGEGLEKKPMIDILYSRGERLGFDLKSKFESSVFQLIPGDTLFLYTDGVSEAVNPEGEEWGESAMKKRLKKLAGQSAKTIRDDIVNAVTAFMGGKSPKDDITFAVLRWKASPGSVAFRSE